MSTLANPLSNPTAAHTGEITTGELLERLGAHAGKPLVFCYDGRDVLPGYHVTEVKAGQFEALDCGANREAWRETFVQLWDIPGDDGRGFMATGKFLAILGTVAARVPFDPGAKLTFEISDGVSAMQLFRADMIDTAGEFVRVSLSRRPASCKPRDRWLEQPPAVGGCGTPAVGKEACCG
jgi:hypothetical protein